MKKIIFIFGIIVFSLTAIAQIKVTEQGHLIIPESPPSLRFGDAVHGGELAGNWGIEYFNGGLNFLKPWESNYRLFIKDNGNVGIGLSSENPAAKLDVYGGTIKFGYTGSQFYIRNYNADPRVSGASGEDIVFYYNGFVDIQVKNCIEYSDKKAKSDIEYITGGLEKVKKLKGVTYTWKSDTTKKKKKTKRSGFIAQEVEPIIPEAVFSNDTNNVLGLNYSSILPFIVEAIKEQALEIELLKKQLAGKGSNGNNGNKSSNTGLIENPTIKLFQNKPNPFNRNTIIEYNIPVDFKSANVYIYNLQGNQVKKYNINEKGKNSIEIQASELKPGMYIYALIVDGAEIDNKRMILTD